MAAGVLLRMLALLRDEEADIARLLWAKTNAAWEAETARLLWAETDAAWGAWMAAGVA